MRRFGLPLLALAAAAAGCRPLVMTPEARQVAISDAAAVDGCKLRGEVFALAPFRTDVEPVNQLKSRALGIGANTLVISREELGQSATKDWKAKAYRCETGKPAETLEASAGRR